MKVRELIERLGSFPPEAEVAIEMSEAQACGEGYSEIVEVKTAKFKKSELPPANYGGDYELGGDAPDGVVLSALEP